MKMMNPERFCTGIHTKHTFYSTTGSRAEAEKGRSRSQRTLLEGMACRRGWGGSGACGDLGSKPGAGVETDTGASCKVRSPVL